MDNAVLFLNKLATDKALQAAMLAAAQNAKTKEEKVAATTKVANDAGFAVSAEELQKAVESLQKTPGKLSDDDLADVAGGFFWGSGDDDLSIGAVSPLLSSEEAQRAALSFSAVCPMSVEDQIKYGLRREGW